MCKNNTKCEAWISLHSVGIMAQGCLKDNTWLNGTVIPCNQSIFNQHVYIDLPTHKLSYIRNVSHGKFGYIDLARYEDGIQSRDVYVKRPIIPGKSLFYEACIQKLVGDRLAKNGFSTGAPSVISIFRLRDNSICFAMEQIPNAVTFDKYLETIPKNSIASAIIDCLFQLCAMIWQLDNTLGINHRDLTPSNILVVENRAPTRQVLLIDNDMFEIETRRTFTFIDFGFSCLGSRTTHVANISLSTVYSKMDPCPKEGRDMYLFLALLYIDYCTHLPPKLLSLFESWLDIPGSNICKFMHKDRENSKKWIYFLIGNDKISHFQSCPHKIITDLQNVMS